ncbi:MAG: GNAT family N-acetyltransferase [Verrucomicrobia bacterium]|nr:MAG: GNAT family N-acetyltransferase [Verrucomicrobiota bacterium]
MKFDAQSAYRIEALSGQDRSSFDCGIEELNRYLRQQAGQDSRKGVAVPFLLVHRQTNVIAGFYTLSNTAVELTALPESLAKKLPRYPIVPATLLGRLAVDVRHRGVGLGEFLLLDALSRSLAASSEVASFAVVVDAKDQSARGFYLKFGFLPFPESPNRLLLPMQTISAMALQ